MILSTIIRPTTSAEADKVFVVGKAEAALAVGDVLMYTATDSATYPLGVGVNKATTGTPRVAGVAVTAATAAGDYLLIQCYGYCKNITTDGAVASTDLYLRASNTGIAIGNTAAEVNTDITTADYNALQTVFAWNLKDDSSTTGEGFIRLM